MHSNIENKIKTPRKHLTRICFDETVSKQHQPRWLGKSQFRSLYTPSSRFPFLTFPTHTFVFFQIQTQIDCCFFTGQLVIGSFSLFRVFSHDRVAGKRLLLLASGSSPPQRSLANSVSAICQLECLREFEVFDLGRIEPSLRDNQCAAS